MSADRTHRTTVMETVKDIDGERTIKTLFYMTRRHATPARSIYKRVPTPQNLFNAMIQNENNAWP